jgi:hypothetical protein
MRPTEIKDLVVGLLTITLIAIALGQFDRLHSFARKEAAKSLKGWSALPQFFPTSPKAVR